MLSARVGKCLARRSRRLALVCSRGAIRAFSSSEERRRRAFSSSEERRRELHARLKQADQAYYYDGGEPLMSDSQYDSLLQELRRLERDTGVAPVDSPTRALPRHASNRVRHKVPMLSLKSVYTREDVTDFLAKVSAGDDDSFEGSVDHGGGAQEHIAVDLKHDGLAVALSYDKHGRLLHGCTRGDGVFGRYIDTSVIEGVPEQLWYDSDSGESVMTADQSSGLSVGETDGFQLRDGGFEVRGEVCLDAQVWGGGEDAYMTGRNIAAGLLLRQTEVPSGVLGFWAYDLVVPEDVCRDDSHVSRMQRLVEAGFRVSPELTRLRAGHPDTADAICGMLDKLAEQREQARELLQTHAKDGHQSGGGRNGGGVCGDEGSEGHTLPVCMRHAVDGLVVKADSLARQAAMGTLSKYPRYAIALKFLHAEQVDATLEQLDWQVGRTGRLTPVAHLSPVQLGGVTVSRATCHSAGWLSGFLSLANADVEASACVDDGVPASSTITEPDQAHPSNRADAGICIGTVADADRHPALPSSPSDPSTHPLEGDTARPQPPPTEPMNEMRIPRTVRVERKGDVIPQVVEFLSSGPEDYVSVQWPQCCPCPVQAPLRGSTQLYCDSDACRTQIVGQLSHFVSKSGIDAPFLGPKRVAQLYDSGFLTTIEDVWTLPDRLESTQDLPDGWGELLVHKVADGVRGALSTCSETRLLSALGIHGVGMATARLLLSDGRSRLEDLCGWDADTLAEAVPGVGPVTARHVVNRMQEWQRPELPGGPTTGPVLSRSSLQDVFGRYAGEVEAVVSEMADGERVCVTGSFVRSRSQVTTALEDRGVRVVSGVSRSTSLLLCGTQPGQSKVVKAQQLEVPVLTLGGHHADADAS